MEGAVVMVTRNLNCASKLVNGTRLIVDKITRHAIICRHIMDVQPDQASVKVAIPRITFIADDSSPIKFVRRQFPLRVAFAMTVHKSQGQTLQQLGLFMRYQMFCHGQLYVAFSRVGDPRRVHIMLPSHDTSFVENIVYTEIFQDDTLSDFSDF
jgi:ATP-dependent DNA helicase PIF1